MNLLGAMNAIYAADLADFTAVRKQAATDARSGGDRDLAGRIGALRKPTLSAWVMNRLVRERPDLVDELTGLGERMRAAQAAIDAPLLTALRPERDALFAAIVAAAGDLGAKVSAAALDEVRGGLVASLADASAEQAVTSGHLTRALSYAGFGEVDLADALAVPIREVARSVGPDTGDAGRRGVDADASGEARADTARADALRADTACADAACADARPVGAVSPTGTEDARIAEAMAVEAAKTAAAAADRRRRALQRIEQDAVEADRLVAAARLELAAAQESAAAAHRRAQELARLATTAARDASHADDAARQAHARVATAESDAKAVATRLREARADG